MKKTDTDSTTAPKALYLQAKQFVLERTASGFWKPGDMIPSENQLVNELGLLRTNQRCRYVYCGAQASLQFIANSQYRRRDHFPRPSLSL